ncbi:MAG: sugar transferase [Saprospiraceae bacterium]|nr:sugar transferase [Saprospiraceae bacterium]
MTQTLPSLTLVKTKELFLLNAPYAVVEFSSPLSDYDVRNIVGATVNDHLRRLLSISNEKDTPYGIVADFSLLAQNDFQFVRTFKKNLLTLNVPIIAVFRENEQVDLLKALQAGVDDCYRMPFDSQSLRDRIEFLHFHKAHLEEAFNEPVEDELVVKMSPFKRAVDIIGSSLAILAFSPILILTAIMIRLESKGPIIYRSKRSGTGYQVFDFLKFRSMYPDADQRLKEMQALNQYKEEGAAFMKIKNDPRITRVGRIIRKTSIDELPQLFNVLKGDMSLVGNRPLPLYEAEQLTKDEWAYRFIAPAGMTGLWQITKRGGNEMSAEERIKLDVTYAKNHSFWYDLKIMLKTPFAIIQKENV